MHIIFMIIRRLLMASLVLIRSNWLCFWNENSERASSVHLNRPCIHDSKLVPRNGKPTEVNGGKLREHHMNARTFNWIGGRRQTQHWQTIIFMEFTNEHVQINRRSFFQFLHTSIAKIFWQIPIAIQIKEVLNASIYVPNMALLL